MIIGGAYLFVDAVEHLAKVFEVSPLILSLLITPIATELPEKLNSLIWIAQGKDNLAFANITGAMVFQSTFPVAVGMVGSPGGWIISAWPARGLRSLPRLCYTVSSRSAGDGVR